MSLLSILLALLAGATQPFQAALNSRLGKEAGNPLIPVCASGLLTGLLLGACLLCSGQVLPKGWAATIHLPWWLWLGGVLGAGYLVAVVITTPKLGAGTVMALVIDTQVIVSVALDHFAALGLDRHPASWGRIAGVALFCIGAFLIQKF